MKLYYKLVLSILFILIASNYSISNTIISIDYCQQKARENYPLIKQYALLDLSKEYTLSNISKGYLPQFSLLAQASYQSEVTGISVNMPGITPMDKDQYKANIDLSQLIWDGGQTYSQRNVAKASNDVDKQNIELQLYDIRNRVNDLYFGVLTVDEQLKQLDIFELDLKSTNQTVESMVKNGTALISDVDVVSVEFLNIEQKRTELTSLRKACIQMLSVMINETIDFNTAFHLPNTVYTASTNVVNRPEIELFNKQRLYLDSQYKSINAKNMPKLALFAQGGYGKPGLNMLANKFDFYGIGGVRLSWGFGGLYTKRNEGRLIDNQKNIIDNQEDVFKHNTSIQLVQLQNEIDKIQALINQDEEVIKLRSKIKTAAESKHKNGIYTVNDLVKDINAENQAKQQKALHQVQYMLNVYKYKHTSGNLE